jgi:hypothetical protein
VFTEDTYVNAAQVESGLAIVFSDPNAFGPELLSAQRRAEDNRLGLWAPNACGDDDIPPGLEIGRIAANPPGPDEDALDQESIEIRNSADRDIQLRGHVHSDESTANRFTVPDVVLAAGESIIVVSGCDPPAGALAWCSDGPVWNNGGDAALLLAPSGQVIDHEMYR